MVSYGTDSASFFSTVEVWSPPPVCCTRKMQRRRSLLPRILFIVVSLVSLYVWDLQSITKQHVATELLPVAIGNPYLGVTLHDDNNIPCHDKVTSFDNASMITREDNDSRLPFHWPQFDDHIRQAIIDGKRMVGTNPRYWTTFSA